MENKCKTIKKESSDFKKKAKQTRQTLCDDNIEVTLTTSAVGLLLFALGIGISMGISRCITKMELKSALRKQRRLLFCEKNDD